MPRSPSRTTSFMANPGELPADDDPLLAFAPVPHKQMKRNSINPERQRKFIAALAATGVVSRAARAIGATPEAMYHLRNRPGAEGLRAAWDAAVDRAMTRLEASAMERAIEGEERMVVSGGQLLGYERRHNDRLAMFFLRNRRPHRYGAELLASIAPGHPFYERVREQVLREIRANEPDIEEVRAEILRKVAAIERARARQAESEPLLIEQEEAEEE